MPELIEIKSQSPIVVLSEESGLNNYYSLSEYYANYKKIPNYALDQCFLAGILTNGVYKKITLTNSFYSHLLITNKGNFIAVLPGEYLVNPEEKDLYILLPNSKALMLILVEHDNRYLAEEMLTKHFEL